MVEVSHDAKHFWQIYFGYNPSHKFNKIHFGQILH